MRSSLDRAVSAAFPLLLGGLLVRLVATGTYRDYVKPSMWPWLTLAGLGLLLAAGWELFARRADRAAHRPAVSWLLLAPVLVVLGLAPGALGSSALERSTRPSAAFVTSDGRWAALPRQSEAIELTIGELVERSYAGDTADGVLVRLTGFAAPSEDSATAFRVVRFRISCCAADAVAMAVRVEGAAVTTGVPQTGAWVTVTGTLQRDEPAVLEPRLTMTDLTPVAEPSSPYETLVSPTG